METKSTKKNQDKFNCLVCEFVTYRKSHWNRHIITNKHKQNMIEYEILMNNENRENEDNEYNQDIQENEDIKHNKKNDHLKIDISNNISTNKKVFEKQQILQRNEQDNICLCGKQYKYRAGLWKHKKYCSIMNNMNLNNANHIVPKIVNSDLSENICDINESNKSYIPIQHEIQYNIETGKEENIQTDTIQEDIHELKTILKEVILENTRLNETIQEQNHKLDNIKVGNTSITQNNFNVMNYLNNECKDAMNIFEFIDSLQIDLKHCQRIADQGYFKPFQDVFIKALTDLEQNKRPIHCTDVKRNSSYIKNYENKWVRDNDNEVLENAFDYLQHKQVIEFRKHKNHKPKWMEDDGNLDFFNNFVCNVYEMNDRDEGPKLMKKLITTTLKSNKLIKE